MNLKFVTTRLKQIKLSMIWVEKRLKYLRCLLTIFCKKFEYLAGQELGYRPSVLEKTKFWYSPFGTLFSKTFEKDKAKSDGKSKNNFNYDSIHTFYKFFKRYDEFEEISLGSKYKKINDFNKRLVKF